MNIQKSSFPLNPVEYFAYHISAEGLTIALDKVKAVGKWPTPRNEKKSSVPWICQLLHPIHRRIQQDLLIPYQKPKESGEILMDRGLRGNIQGSEFTILLCNYSLQFRPRPANQGPNIR